MKTKDIHPKVSVVIPVYNGSNYLKQAIDSALAQTYDNIEIIVVNDGSNDEGATEEIAKSYGEKIRYFRKKNGGVASTLNFGIQKMTGSYFSWLSHDDLYERTKIADQISVATSLQEESIIVCNARILFENGIKKEALIDKRAFGFFDIFLATAADVGINGCSLLIPKKALVESKGFDPSLPVTQDYDLWYRLSFKHKYRFVLLEKNLVIYRRHAEQDSIQKQALCLRAGDDLRYDILKNIEYARFKEYFVDNKANLRHAWDNYGLYKTRGFKKTASMMLKNLLRYYFENDLEKFYELYDSEIEQRIGRKEAGGVRNKKLTDSDRRRIMREYDALLKSRTDHYPIKNYPVKESSQPKTRIHRIARRLNESMRRDGILLTGEKIVRKIHEKVTRAVNK